MGWIVEDRKPHPWRSANRAAYCSQMTRSRALSTMRTTAQIVRGYRGPALFSFGFRPFFLLAGLFGASAVPLWIAAMTTGALPGSFTRDWHVHEMLFGYTSAVISGYLLVAGANWTGSYPVAGRPLIALVALWVSGRAAMIAGEPGGFLAAAVDAAFLPIFGAALWREQLAARKGRNLIPCLVVTLLSVANIAFHLRFRFPGLGETAERFALGLIAFLIAVVGGRLLPSFTRNWIANHGSGAEPAQHGRFDSLVVALTACALASWQIAPSSVATGIILALCGIANLVRMTRWRGGSVLAEGGLVALHLGYLWLSLGLILLGLSVCAPDVFSQTSAVHAISSGAIGVMTLAMMTRMTLSHTGRSRSVGRLTLAAYVLLNSAAIVRVAAPYFPDLLLELLAGSAILWSGAFSLFSFVYGPMLLTPRTARVDDRDQRRAHGGTSG